MPAPQAQPNQQPRQRRFVVFDFIYYIFFFLPSFLPSFLPFFTHTLHILCFTDRGKGQREVRFTAGKKLTIHSFILDIFFFHFFTLKSLIDLFVLIWQFDSFGRSVFETTCNPILWGHYYTLQNSHVSPIVPPYTVQFHRQFLVEYSAGGVVGVWEAGIFN